MLTMDHIHTEACVYTLSEPTFVCPACKRFVETLKSPSQWMKDTEASDSKGG